MIDELQYNQLLDKISDLKTLLTQTEKHLCEKIERLENAINIVNVEIRDSQKSILKHEMEITQSKKDIDNLGNLVRNSEKTCQFENQAQHKKLFEKVDRLENSMAFYKGAMFLIPFILTALYFFINLYISKQ